jgi:hypothetical protein
MKSEKKCRYLRKAERCCQCGGEARRREVHMKGTVGGSVLFLMAPVIAAASPVDVVAARNKPFCERVLNDFRRT